MKKTCPGKYVHRLKLEKPMLDGRMTEFVDGIVQQMLFIANMNVNKLVQVIFMLMLKCF